MRGPGASRRAGCALALAFVVMANPGCAGEPTLPAISCHQSADDVLIPRALRFRVLVLSDSRFESPPGLAAWAEELQRVSETGDIDGDGVAEFIGLIDSRVELHEVSFDRRLVDLLEELGPADWYERHLPWAVLLFSTGDVGPEFYPAASGMPSYVRLLGIAGGVPADLVPDWTRDRDGVLADPRMASEEPLCRGVDGMEPLPAPALIDPPPYSLLGQYLVSLCSEDWNAELADPIIEVLSDVLGAGACYDLPRVLGEMDGMATCTMYEDLAPAAPFDCEDLPGRVPAGTVDGRLRCEVEQRRPTREGEPASPGWFMDGGSDWGERLCGESSPWRYLRFTSDAHPMPRSRVRLECLECTEIPPDAGSPDAG